MIYRVRYQSLTACYGPRFIDAASVMEAKLKFAKGAFSEGEMSLIKVEPADLEDALEEVKRREW